MKRKEIIAQLNEAQLAELVAIIEQGGYDYRVNERNKDVVLHFLKEDEPPGQTALRHDLTRERIRQIAVKTATWLVHCYFKKEHERVKNLVHKPAQPGLMEELFGEEYKGRLKNILSKNDIETPEELFACTISDLMRFRDMGKKTLAIITTALEAKGIKLAKNAKELKQKQWDEMLLQLNFDNRTLNVLYVNGVTKLDQLLNCSLYDLQTFRNAGPKTVAAITAALAANGLKLKQADEALAQLNFDSLILNAFIKADIITLEGLLQKSVKEIARLKNLGKGSVNTIISKLAERGLKLKER